MISVCQNSENCIKKSEFYYMIHYISARETEREKIEDMDNDSKRVLASQIVR